MIQIRCLYSIVYVLCTKANNLLSTSVSARWVRLSACAGAGSFNRSNRSKEDGSGH